MTTSEEKILFCKLSSLVYLKPEEISTIFFQRPIEKKWDFVYRFEERPIFYKTAGDCEMLIVKVKTKRIIAFRGTSSRADVLTDLNITKTKFQDLCFYQGFVPEVHTGFYLQFLTVRDFLVTHLIGCKEREIVFTGHSLGGALATIGAAYTKAYFSEKVVDCITFGSPRVGDSLFVKFFKLKIRESIRYVNDNDPVPSLPTSWRFEHVPGCKWIYADQIFKEVGYWRTWRFFKNSLISLTGYGYNPASDHSITEYILDLEDILV